MSVIDHWWARSPASGVGISTGPAGLLVVDLDCHAATRPLEPSAILPGLEVSEAELRSIHSGLDAFRALARTYQAEDMIEGQSTLTVRTPSGGMHLYFRVPWQTRWSCSVGGDHGGRSLGWQIDVRAHGGYIVAPGTRVAAGSYAPVGHRRMPSHLPGWLAGALERTGHLMRASTPSPRRAVVPNRARLATMTPATTTAWAASVTATALGAVADCASSPEGSGWNTKVNRAAFTLGGLLAAGFIASESDARSALLTAAVHARPAREREALSIIRSGLAAGQLQPLIPKDR